MVNFIFISHDFFTTCIYVYKNQSKYILSRRLTLNWNVGNDDFRYSHSQQYPWILRRVICFCMVLSKILFNQEPSLPKNFREHTEITSAALRTVGRNKMQNAPN